MKKKSKVLHGEKIVEGIGIGVLFYIDKDFSTIPHLCLLDSAIPDETARFLNAVDKSEKELQKIMDDSALQGDARSILEAHRMMLVDSTMIDAIKTEIATNKINAEWAVLNVYNNMIQMLSGKSSDYYIKAKIADLEVVKEKIISALYLKTNNQQKELPKEDFILCSKNLTVSELYEVSKNPLLKGIALEMPGGVSHITVVLRALGIPSVLSVPNLIKELDYGDHLIVDGVNGEVFLRPSKKIQQDYLEHKKIYDDYIAKFLKDADKPVQSKDGFQMAIGANIEMENEIELAKKYGADNIGLFRTEFLVLENNKMPSEDEHYNIYYQLLHRAFPMSVTIRTFDFGGDKSGNVITTSSPMGLRGVRFSKFAPELFIPQIRGLLRASVLGNLKILLPFISRIDEIDDFKTLLKNEAKELGLENNLKKIKIGVMIEVPAALFIAEMLAKKVDFFSVGTNDLIQYLMAVERKDKSMSDYFTGYHPSVVRSLYNISRVAKEHNIDISICGELGGDPFFSLVFLAMGFNALSMSAMSIPIIKKIIKNGYLREGQDMLNKILMIDNDKEMKEFLETEMKKKYPNVFKKIWINDFSKKGGKNDA